MQMTKYELNQEVQELRKQGKSLVEIEKVTGVSRGTLRYWCRDIELTVDQRQKLNDNQKQKGLEGRLVGVQKNKEEREDRKNRYAEEGDRLIGKLSNRELLLVGTALYWAEGLKAQRTISFSNTDPEMIKIFIRWLVECLGIHREDLRAHLHIHADINETEERRYWEEVTALPEEHFYKTYRSKNFKPQGNIKRILHGVCTIRVQKSTNLFYQVEGMIEKLAQGPLAQLVRASDS